MIKNTKIKVLLAILSVIVILILATNSVQAREIRNIKNFRIDSYRFYWTEFARKETRKNYVMNFDRPEGRKRIVVRSQLINSNIDPRSGWGLTYEGTRNNFSNDGQPGYKYAVILTRQYDWDGVAFVSGSWSPDDR